MPWFYLSFASKEKFLGGCIVEARSAEEAPRVAAAHGINPGGEVLVIPSPEPDRPGPLPTYRLLSRAEMGDGSTMAGLRDEGMSPPDDALLVTDPKERN